MSGGEARDDVPAKVRRVVIIGSGGAGKSTLARKLAVALRGDHIELDVLAFDGRLGPVAFEVLHERLVHSLSAERWVVEGMHREEIRRFALSVADLVVWVDTARTLVAYRLVRRLLEHLLRRTERHGRLIRVADLPREMRFVGKTLRKYEQRRQYATGLARAADAMGVPTVVVRSSGEINALLKKVALA